MPATPLPLTKMPSRNHYNPLRSRTNTLDLRAIALQARGSGSLGIPVIATEQNPKALGSTVDEVKSALPKDTPIVSKTLFSMLTPEVESWLGDRPSVKQVCACYMLKAAIVLAPEPTMHAFLGITGAYVSSSTNSNRLAVAKRMHCMILP